MTALRRAAGGLFLFLWVGGLVAYLFLGGPPPHVAWTAPLFLFAAALLVLLTAPDRRLAGALLAVGAVGFAAEVLGVHSGFPFGAYRYTGALGPRLWGVPVALAPAWLVLAAHAREVAGRLGLAAAPATLFGAAWMTCVDLVIDPLAAGPLGYWQWTQEGLYFGVPLSNFAGWLGVSLVAMALVVGLAGGPVGALRRPHPGAHFVGVGVILFFAALAGGLALPGPALVGLALVGADFAAARWDRLHLARVDPSLDLMDQR